MNIGIKNKLLTYYLYFFALIYVTSIVVGIYNNYSPVPFWDMWNGYLGFYVKFMDGDWNLIFSQHNEHRIIFSRVLFFIDNYFFQGSIVFLLLANFILMILIAYVYICIQKYLIADIYKRRILNAITIILIFSWIQHENITWGFQSQFFVAYLFPLTAFYFLVLHKVKDEKNLFYFSLALLFGVLSIGSMANGVLALPILILLSFILKLDYKKIITTILIAIFFLYLHFSFYIQPIHHSSFSDGILNNPILFTQYLLTYLGAPFYFMIGKSYHIAQFFGFLLIGGSLFFTYKYFKEKENKNLMVLPLLAMILYVGGTAFGTSGGRCEAGIGAALSSRYLTPSIVVWVAFISLVFYFLSKTRYVKILLLFIILIPVLLLKFQIKTFDRDESLLYEYKLAALSAELYVRDEIYLKKIFPFIDWFMQMLPLGVNSNSSIFGNELFIDLNEKINKEFIDISDFQKVNGYIDRYEDISSDQNFFRLQGWYVDKIQENKNKRLAILNDKYKIIGYVLTGIDRVDVASIFNTSNTKLGFAGYIISSDSYSKLFIVDALNKSYAEIDAIQIKQKKPPYSINKFDGLYDNINLLSENSIVFSSFKFGSVFDYKVKENSKVYGSYIGGDNFEGCILLKVTKNSKLLFYTGPVSIGQNITFKNKEGHVLYQGTLPSATELKLMSFRDKNLPEDFMIEICDKGNTWGEWSAVELKENK